MTGYTLIHTQLPNSEVVVFMVSRRGTYEPIELQRIQIDKP